MSIPLIDKIKPKNNGKFPLVDAEDVLMPDGSRLSTWTGNDIPVFDLVTLGLADIPLDGTAVKRETDTTEIMTALEAGAVRFHVKMSGGGLQFDIVCTMHDISGPTGGTYFCAYSLDPFGGVPMMVTIVVEDGSITARCTVLGSGTEESAPATSIDLSALDSAGKVVETFADGTSKTTTLEFDENGNPVKITDGDGNVTTLIW